MERNCTIYAHITKDNHIYIGQTSNKPKYRWGHNGNSYKTNPYMMAAIQRYGWDNIEHRIIAENLSRDEANIMEVALIASYRNNPKYKVMNITDGGLGHTGYIFPQDVKDRLSKNMVGRVKITNGKEDKMLPESEIEPYLNAGWRRGTCLTWNDDQRKQISNRLKGIPHSESRKLHNSISQRQFIWLNDGKQNLRIKKVFAGDFLSKGFAPGKIQKNIKDAIWISINNSAKLIPKSELNTYLAEGWVLGMGTKGGNGGANIGKLRIHKADKRKYVPKSELNTYLAEGWVLGW